MKLWTFDLILSAVRMAGVCAALVALPSLSRADIKLGGNLGPGDSYDTVNGLTVGNGFDANHYAQGTSFLSLATAQLGTLKIALSCVFPGACPDGFTVALTDDNGNQPGTALENFTVPGVSLGDFGSNNPVILLTSALHPTLTAGTQYWVTVSSDLNNSIAWNFNSTGDTSAEALSTDGGATWLSPSGLTPGAFEADAVPEPTSVLLLFTVVGLAAALRSRRRRAAAAGRSTC